MGSILVTIFGWVAQIIGMILGVVIMALSWFIVFALQLNESITSLPVVTTGMQITTSLTNLGLMTVLIVIAIATILRRQSYGIKALLANLIIAALLVNFSLLIAGGILHVADAFTTFFMNQSIPTSSSGVSGIEDFGSTLGQVFKPQAVGSISFNTNSTGTAAMASDAIANAGNSMLIDLSMPAFALFYALSIIIVLVALFIMLLIRFVYLVVLFILMPLAWVCWITPLTKDLWQKWWKHFIHWTLFSPIVMMFLYITFATMSQMDKIQQLTLSDKDSQAAKLALGSSSIISVVGQEIALIGLTLGGLIAANSMGIAGAGVALNTAKGVGNSIGNYAKQKGTRALTSPLRSSTGQSIIGAMQRSQLGLVHSLGRVAGSVAQTTGGKAEVDEERKKAENLDDDSLKNLNQGRTRYDATKVAYLEQLDKRGMLTDADKRGMIENENKFSQYGASGFVNKIKEKSLYDDKTLPALKDLETAIANLKKGTGSQNDVDVKQDALKKVVSDKLSGMEEDDQKSLIKSLKSSFKNYNPNDVNMAGESKDSHDAKQDALSFALSNNPTLYNNAISKIDGASAANVTTKILSHKIDQLQKQGKINPTQAQDFKNKALKGDTASMTDLLKTLRSSGAEHDEFVKNVVGSSAGARTLGIVTGRHFVTKSSVANTIKI